MIDLIDGPALEILEYFAEHDGGIMNDFRPTRTHMDRYPFLKEWGFLELGRDPDNHRKRPVHLTERGMSVLQAMRFIESMQAKP